MKSFLSVCALKAFAAKSLRGLFALDGLQAACGCCLRLSTDCGFFVAILKIDKINTINNS